MVQHANPGPLGLCAFGLTTTLLSLHNVGAFPLTGMIAGMAIFYGGIAQVIAGGFEMSHGNTFGGLVFSSYGFFWLSLVAAWVWEGMGEVAAPDSVSMCLYLFMWGLFTFGMWWVAIRTSVALTVIFTTLVITFALLGVGNAVKAADYVGGATVVIRIAGAFGIVCGLAAIYTGIAELLNEKYGKTVMPIGPLGKKPSPTHVDMHHSLHSADLSPSPSSSSELQLHPNDLHDFHQNELHELHPPHLDEVHLPASTSPEPHATA